MLSHDEKITIFKSLYCGKPKNEQDTFLMGLVDVEDIKRRRPKYPEPKQNRRGNFKYHVLNGSVRREVCKKAFLSLYALSSKAVFRLTTLLSNYSRPTDKRGRHGNRGNAIPDAIICKIHTHISAFPTKETHYGSKPLKYLESTLTVKKMYEMFCLENGDLAKRVKYEYYLKQFNENFGYRFGRPQVDVCPTCEELAVKLKSHVLNDNAKRVASAELIIHKRRASKFYKKIENVRDLCAQNQHIGAIVFDYMQNLPLPDMPVNDMFYLRKLWQYVFGVHNLKTNDATFYTYFEGTAKRGSNEVASFLKDYLDTIPKQITELHIFSDACGGQNRNHTIIRLLSALTMHGRFTEIHQYFPVRGHSFLPCDRDFGLIKRIVRRRDRIFTPMEYISIIANAKKTRPYFVVKLVQTEDILDYKSWWPKYFKKSCTETTTRKRGAGENRQKFSISTYKHFIFKSSTPGYVIANDFIDGFVTSTYNLAKTANKPQLPTDRAYTQKVPIKTKKIEDIAKIVKYIPDEHQPFYTQFENWPTTALEYDSE